MKRPTDKYNDPDPRTFRMLLIRGGLLLLTAAAVGTLAGWTKRARAADDVKSPDAAFVSRRLGTMSEQLKTAQGELDLMQLQLDRANAIMHNSARYQIPSDLAADIYDIALSEGIDPALGFQLVKIESSFRSGVRSPMGAIGYTQVQVATARFYRPGVTEKELYDRINSMSDRFDRVAASLQQKEGTMGLLLHDKAMYEKFNGTLDEARSLIAAIKADPKKYLNIRVSLF